MNRCWTISARSKKAKAAIARATRGGCLTKQGARELARALRSEGHVVSVHASRGLAGGQGGAAANRGRYKPLAPGKSAIEQHRAAQAARDRIIAAIESGKFELCPKGSAKNAPTSAPASGPPGSHGNRTASEIEAVRRRFEKAGL